MNDHGLRGVSASSNSNLKSLFLRPPRPNLGLNFLFCSILSFDVMNNKSCGGARVVWVKVQRCKAYSVVQSVEE